MRQCHLAALAGLAVEVAARFLFRGINRRERRRYQALGFWGMYPALRRHAEVFAELDRHRRAGL